VAAALRRESHGATFALVESAENLIRLKSQLAELDELLRFAEGLFNRYAGEVLKDEGTAIRRVAAAALVRLPGCLRSISLLAHHGQALDAMNVDRTLLELAIMALWVGDAEARAAQLSAKHSKDWATGLGRVRPYREFSEEVKGFLGQLTEESLGSQKLILKACAEEAIDTPELKRREMATYLYNWLYDLLSAAAHGDSRFARLIATGNEIAFVSSALEYGLAAAEYLLIATSPQLGFTEELAAWLQKQHQGAK